MNPRALPALAFLFLCTAAGAQDFGDEVWNVVRSPTPGFGMARGEEAPFAFYGEIPGEYVPLKCERSSTYRFVAFANEAGGLNVGICRRDLKRIGALSAAARPALDALLAELFRGRAAPTPAERARRGLDYVRRSAPDGAQEHAFPVLLLGHGILQIDTFILIPPSGDRAIVVQANVYKLCEDFGPKLNTPLCTDRRKALADIARLVAALP